MGMSRRFPISFPVVTTETFITKTTGQRCGLHTATYVFLLHKDNLYFFNIVFLSKEIAKLS